MKIIKTMFNLFKRSPRAPKYSPPQSGLELEDAASLSSSSEILNNQSGDSIYVDDEGQLLLPNDAQEWVILPDLISLGSVDVDEQFGEKQADADLN